MNDEIRCQIQQIKREWDAVENTNKRLSIAFDTMLNAVDVFNKERIADISVADAIARLRLELLKDKEPGSYYYTWQSNIAMCFYDAFLNENPVPLNKERLHKISNKAAVNFIDILCLTNGSNTGLIKPSESQASQ